MQLDTLSLPDDPPEYAQGLLLSSYVALLPGAPALREDVSLQQESTQEEVLHAIATPHLSLCSNFAPATRHVPTCCAVVQLVTRVIDSLVKRTRPDGVNVLCYGFRKVSDRCARSTCASRMRGFI